MTLFLRIYAKSPTAQRLARGEAEPLGVWPPFEPDQHATLRAASADLGGGFYTVVRADLTDEVDGDGRGLWRITKPVEPTRKPVGVTRRDRLKLSIDAEVLRQRLNAVW